MGYPFLQFHARFLLFTPMTFLTPYCHHGIAQNSHNVRDALVYCLDALFVFLHIFIEEVFVMSSAQFRIESRDPLSGSLLPCAPMKSLYGNCSLAVAVAVKSVADPTRQQVRVVHVPSGEIIFQTTPPGQGA